MISMDEKEACEKYKAKLHMLGKSTDGLFVVNKDKPGIEVNISKLLEIISNTQVLYIPSFVRFIRLPPQYSLDNLFGYVSPYEKLEKQVKRIVLSENVELNEIAYKAFKRFKNLEVISMTKEQADQFKEVIQQREIKYKIEIKGRKQ